jgi:phosphoribosylformylglycinamidine synthase PurS subunit
MKIRVYVSLKNGVLDPAGVTVKGALQRMGFNDVNDVRTGKFIELELAQTDRTKAEAEVAQMCEKLLANTVIEDYKIVAA